MNQQAFDDFMLKLKQDPSLQQELRARFSHPERGVPAAEFADFAAGKGYRFDTGDMHDELHDAELGAVHGGAAFDAFLEIEGIKGETEDRMHKPFTVAFRF